MVLPTTATFSVREADPAAIDPDTFDGSTTNDQWVLIDVDNLWMPQDRQSGFLDFVWHLVYLVEVCLGDLQMLNGWSSKLGYPILSLTGCKTYGATKACSPLKPAPMGCLFLGTWALEDSIHRMANGKRLMKKYEEDGLLSAWESL